MDFSFPKTVFRYLTNFNCRMIILLLLILEMSSCSAKQFPIESHAIHHNHEVHGRSTNRNCRKVLYASLTAQTIYLPKSDDPNEIIYCEWTIRARAPSLKIGIATVNQYLDFYNTNSFSIDIYDGPSAKHDKLSFWHGRDDFHPYHFDALTSTRNVLFVNYTAHGGEIDLHMDLLFYLCGGKIDVELKIGSPIIDRNTTFEVPRLLQCTWVIEKPADVSYGLLQFYTLSVPNCHTLSVKTDSGRLISVHISKNSDFNSSSNGSSTLDEFAIARQELHESFDDSNDLSTETSGWNTNLTNIYEGLKPFHEIDICNSSIKGVMFNGSDVILTYSMLYPEKKYGFNAFFQFLHLPVSAIRPPAVENPVRTWFINYGALVFCSIGIVIGCIVMYCQARRCSTSTKRSTYVYGNAVNNGNTAPNPRPNNVFSNSESRPFARPICASEQLIELKETEFSISDIEEETEFTEETLNHQDLATERRKTYSRNSRNYEQGKDALSIHAAAGHDTLLVPEANYKKASVTTIP